MNRMTRLGLAVMGLAALSGCRTATKITELPRVDLEVEKSGGNRGYLIGTPPAAGEGKTTRQMVQTDIEIPSFYRPTHNQQSVSVGVSGAAQVTPADITASAPAGPYDTYVVKKGDALWSIAAKPEIYGKASVWRRIYDANRDVLKSPDRLKAGMTLKIPRSGAAAASETAGGTYSK